MSEKTKTCPECGHWTEAGKADNRDRYKQRPIYGTDFSKPLSVLVEDIRSQVTLARGRIHDIMYGAGWEDRLSHAEGALTCVLIALWKTAEEMRQFEAVRTLAAEKANVDSGGVS